jgi:glycosyltransferase involved in cell wall biosynthesis
MTAESHQPPVAVIICTRNRPDLVPRAVASVLANTYPAFRLLVIDQSTSAATETALQPFTADARFSYLRTPTAGEAIARNIGLRHTTEPIIACTDHDCVAASDWLTRLVGGFAARPEAQLVFGRLSPPAWYVAHHGIVPVFEPATGAAAGRVWRGVVLGMSANMGLRRPLPTRIGYFDEAMGAGGALAAAEDFDFAVRAAAAGAVVSIVPDAVVVHEGGVRSPSEAPSLWYRDGYGIGAVMAKAVKCGMWIGALALGRFVVGDLVAPGRLVLRGRHPQGLRRVTYTAAGVVAGCVAGLRWPVERGPDGYLFRRRGRSPAPLPASAPVSDAASPFSDSVAPTDASPKAERRHG